MMQFKQDGIKSFKGLMIGVLQVLVQGMGDALQTIVDELDNELPHPGPGWESVGKKERRLSTLFGLTLVISRRGYRRRGGNGAANGLFFPLDEALGLASEERFCPLVQHLGISLATETSFRKAAELLSSVFMVPVSHQQVHRWLQTAGAEREGEESEKVSAAFERGEEISAGTRVVPALVVEADGVFIRQQRQAKRWQEYKLGVVHEGWEATSPDGKRVRLKEKACWGGNLTTDSFWERGVITLANRYDLTGLERVLLNGDGAAWIKEGQAHLGPAEFYLDPFHRNQALRRGLEGDLLSKAQSAVEAEDWSQLESILDQAVEAAKDPEAKKRAQDTRRYLKANWDALGDWRKQTGTQPAGAKALGTMESQVRHIAAKRMKRNGTSWCPNGANNMIQLRLLAQAGSLDSWLDGRNDARWASSTAHGNGRVASEALNRLSKADPAGWLRAGLPYLESQSTHTPLGRALKGLSRLRVAS